MSEESTLEIAVDVRGAATRRWPALTVLGHADVRRVGDRARLGSGRMALSRQLPLFMPPRYRAPDDVGEDELLEALRAHRFRLAPTAEALNVSRATLYALIEQSSRVRKASDLTFAEVVEALAESRGDAKRAAARLEVSARALEIRMNALGIG